MTLVAARSEPRRENKVVVCCRPADLRFALISERANTSLFPLLFGDYLLLLVAFWRNLSENPYSMLYRCYFRLFWRAGHETQHKRNSGSPRRFSCALFSTPSCRLLSCNLSLSRFPVFFLTVLTLSSCRAITCSPPISHRLFGLLSIRVLCRATLGAWVRRVQYVTKFWVQF